MRKKTTLALILMMNLACAMAQKSGTTGPLSWNYNETSKELTITGNGAMPNYDYGAAPWQEYQEGIETVNVGSGVTSIGSNAFCNCIYMTTLSLPAGMETIGDFAFGWCQNLSSLTVRVADPTSIELGLIPFFRGANAVDCTLRVPVGSKAKYENADLWKDFAPNIEELTSDGIDSATADSQQADKAERVYSRDGVQLRGTLGQQQKGVYIVGGKKVVKR